MLESVEPVGDLDRLIFGAKNFGVVVNLNERQIYHALENGRLDADKFGKKWVSTKRRLLNSVGRKASPTPTIASPPLVPEQLPPVGDDR